MRRVYGSEVQITAGTIGNLAAMKPGVFSRRVPTSQLFENRLNKGKQKQTDLRKYKSTEWAEVRRAHQTQNPRKKRTDHFQNRNVDCLPFKHELEARQGIISYQTLRRVTTPKSSGPAEARPSKTSEVAGRVKLYRPRKPASPKETDAEERKRKVGYLLDVLDARNEIVDPTKPKKSQTAVDFMTSGRQMRPSGSNVIFNVTTKALPPLASKSKKNTQPIPGHYGTERGSNPMVLIQSQYKALKTPEDQMRGQIETDYSKKKPLALPMSSTDVRMKLTTPPEVVQIAEATAQEAPAHELPIGDSDDAVDNAFMTQFPQGDTRVEELGNELKEKLKKSKWRTRGMKHGERQLKKCLKFMGIKDKKMLDHFYPDFRLVLERKIEKQYQDEMEEMLETKGMLVRDMNDQLVKAGQPQYQMMELYNTGGRAKSAEGCRKLISRKAFLNEDHERRLQAMQTDQEPKRLKICKFEHDKLGAMFKKERERERNELQMIQLKKQNKDFPYLEKVKKAKVRDTTERKHVRELAKTKLLRIGDQVLAALKEQRRKKGLLDEEFYLQTKSEMEKHFNPEDFVDTQFQGLSIDDLTDYMAKALRLETRIQHPNMLDTSNRMHASTGPTDVYQKNQNSYKEKTAFFAGLRKKWRVQKGYCSVFERARHQRTIRNKQRLKHLAWKQQRRQKRRSLANAIIRYVQEQKQAKRQFVTAQLSSEQRQSGVAPSKVSQSTLELDRTVRMEKTQTPGEYSSARVPDVWGGSRIDRQSWAPPQFGAVGERERSQRVYPAAHQSGETLPPSSTVSRQIIGRAALTVAQKSEGPAGGLDAPPTGLREQLGVQSEKASHLQTHENAAMLNAGSIYEWAQVYEEKSRREGYDSRDHRGRSKASEAAHDLEELDRLLSMQARPEANEDLAAPIKLVPVHEHKVKIDLTGQGAQNPDLDTGVRASEEDGIGDHIQQFESLPRGSAIVEIKDELASAQPRQGDRSATVNVAKKHIKNKGSGLQTVDTAKVQRSLPTDQAGVADYVDQQLVINGSIPKDAVDQILFNQASQLRSSAPRTDGGPAAKDSAISSVVLSPDEKRRLRGKQSHKDSIFKKAKELETKFSAVAEYQSQHQADGRLEPQTSLHTRHSPILAQSRALSDRGSRNGSGAAQKEPEAEGKDEAQKATGPSQVMISYSGPLAKLDEEMQKQLNSTKSVKQLTESHIIKIVYPEVQLSKNAVHNAFPLRSQQTDHAKRQRNLERLVRQAQQLSYPFSQTTEKRMTATPPEVTSPHSPTSQKGSGKVHQIPASIPSGEVREDGSDCSPGTKGADSPLYKYEHDRQSRNANKLGATAMRDRELTRGSRGSREDSLAKNNSEKNLMVSGKTFGSVERPKEAQPAQPREVPVFFPPELSGIKAEDQDLLANDGDADTNEQVPTFTQQVRLSAGSGLPEETVLKENSVVTQGRGQFNHTFLEGAVDAGPHDYEQSLPQILLNDQFPSGQLTEVRNSAVKVVSHAASAEMFRGIAGASAMDGLQGPPPSQLKIGPKESNTTQYKEPRQFVKPTAPKPKATPMDPAMARQALGPRKVATDTAGRSIPVTSIESARGSKVVKSFDSDQLPKYLPPTYGQQRSIPGNVDLVPKIKVQTVKPQLEERKAAEISASPQQIFEAPSPTSIKQALSNQNTVLEKARQLQKLEPPVAIRQRGQSTVSKALHVAKSYGERRNFIQRNKMLHGVVKNADLDHVKSQQLSGITQSKERLPRTEGESGMPSVHEEPSPFVAIEAFQPWNFIHNEQYYSKMASVYPKSFNVTGQGVSQTRVMTATQIITENRRRQKTLPPSQGTYHASAGVTRPPIVTANMLAANPNAHYISFERRQANFMVDSHTMPEDATGTDALEATEAMIRESNPLTLNMVTHMTEEEREKVLQILSAESAETPHEAPKHLSTGSPTEQMAGETRRQGTIEEQQKGVHVRQIEFPMASFANPMRKSFESGSGMQMAGIQSKPPQPTTQRVQMTPNLGNPYAITELRGNKKTLRKDLKTSASIADSFGVRGQGLATQQRTVSLAGTSGKNADLQGLKASAQGSGLTLARRGSQRSAKVHSSAADYTKIDLKGQATPIKIQAEEQTLPVEKSERTPAK